MSRLTRSLRYATASYWRIFCLALFVGAIVGAVLLMLLPQASGLLLLGLYSIPSNSFIPIPHEPAILYYAKFYPPVWIAVAGTVGTGVAAFADYEVLGRTLRHPRLHGLRDAGGYRWAVRWIMARPFVTVVVFAATPLPVYVVRVLAPAAGYSVWRYALAMMVGRFPRFYVLAWFGYMFPIPTWVLIALFAVLIAGVVYAALKGSDDTQTLADTGDAPTLADADDAPTLADAGDAPVGDAPPGTGATSAGPNSSLPVVD